MPRDHHTVSDHNPTYVTGAERLRISFTTVVLPEHVQFAAMQERLLPEHRRPDGYGLAFLESEEYSALYIGPMEQIRAYDALDDVAGQTLDASKGVCYPSWPTGPAWDDLIPSLTWTKGGEGIVTAFEHRGGKVVVYEYLADRDGEQVPMVAMHCEYCHINPDTHLDLQQESRGPQDRRWIGAKARQHVHYANRPNAECRPRNPLYAEVVTQVANELHGTDNPVVSAESWCATTGPCSVIRHLRVREAVKP